MPETPDTSLEPKTFVAATLALALERVRTELGSEAVILDTREFQRSKWQFWKREARWFEVTAAVGVSTPTRFLKAYSGSPVLPERDGGMRSPNGEHNATMGKSHEPTAPNAVQIDDLNNFFGYPEPSQSQQESFPVEVGEDVSGDSTDDFDPLSSESTFGSTSQESSYLIDEGPPIGATGDGQDHSITHIRNRIHRSELRPDDLIVAPNVRHRPPANRDSPEAAMRQRLGVFPGSSGPIARQSNRIAADISAESLATFAKLTTEGMDDETARQIVDALEAIRGSEAAPGMVKRNLQSLLEQQVRIAAPISIVPGKRQVVAVVGSTGTGKTTTVAKLAARLRLASGGRLGLISVDSYRIEAAEQLRAYADIINLPIRMATTPREIRRALDELAGVDIVLIDTAGRSPRDEQKMLDLQQILVEAAPAETLLTVSATMELGMLRSATQPFIAAGATQLVVTKLDEAFGLAGLATVAQGVDIPFGYFTTGQDVPQDIEAVTPRRYARLVMGDEFVHIGKRENIA